MSGDELVEISYHSVNPRCLSEGSLITTGEDSLSCRRVRAMPTFVLRLIAPRPNFAQTITESELEIMNSHAAHWRPYVERGDMVVFGPVLTDDDSYGIAVVETDDEQALRD